MDEEFDYMARAHLERGEKWRDIIREVPAINFDQSWGVKIIPPFAGAVARFLVEKGGASVSVYLDWYGRLGVMDTPYWECYPDAEDNNARFMVGEEADLTAAIRKSLNRQIRQKAKADD